MYGANYNAWSVIAGETPTATKWNYLGTNDAQFDTDIEDLFQGKRGIVELTDGATVNIDGNSNYNIFELILGGDRSLTISNMIAGQAILLRLIQDGTGSRSISSWFSGDTVKWPGGSEPSLSTAAGEIDSFLIICTDTDTYEIYFAGFGMKASS